MDHSFLRHLKPAGARLPANEWHIYHHCIGCTDLIAGKRAPTRFALRTKKPLTPWGKRL